MRHAPSLPLSLLLLLCGFLSLPKTASEPIKAGFTGAFSPYFHLIAQINPFSSGAASKTEAELQRLRLENQLLANEISLLKELVEQEFLLLQQAQDELYLKNTSKELLAERERELVEQFNLQLFTVPAKVIFRPLNSWTSTLIVQAGEADNERLGRKAIGKNSPVVIGNKVVGIIDQVGKKESLVRLITDSGLHLAVRAKRGPQLLAKGEITGEGRPFLRGKRMLLSGSGFNYDFPDQEGPARDLRSGAPIHGSPSDMPTPVLLPNDLLVTTGMDGIYPKGLEVGYVKKIHALKEGDYSYDLDASPAVNNLENLNLVFILPPLYTNELN
ncbi:MAG: rod shape-determining protein MreC [Parachlamydiaceae bacterium]